MAENIYVNRYTTTPPYRQQHFTYLRQYYPELAEKIDNYFGRVMNYLKEAQRDITILNLPPGPERDTEAMILNLDTTGNTPEEIKRNKERKEKYIENIETTKESSAYGSALSYLPLIFHEACLRDEVQDAIETDVEYQRDCADLLYAMQALTYANEDLKNASMNIRMVNGMPVAENGQLISPYKMLKMDDDAYRNVALLFDTYGYTLLKQELHRI
ncbi:MAG: hypothetical protein QXE05_06090 [Nitrososphaeria archaeon]